MNTPRALLAFYAIAVAIAAAVVVVRIVVTSSAPDAGEWLPRYWAWLDAHRTYINLPNLVAFGWSEPLALLAAVFALAPSVAALVVAAGTGGKAAVLQLLSRLKPIPDARFRAAGLRAYTWLIAGNVIITIAMLFAVQRLAGDAAFARVWESLGASVAFAAFYIVLGGFLDEGGVLEELGWRGYLHPCLQELLDSPLVVATLIGVLWYAWHLPREVVAWISAAPLPPRYFVNQATFVLLCVSLSILTAWFVNRTGGSVLPAILIHGGTNFWSKAISLPLWVVLGFGVRDLLVVLLALAVLAIAGPRLGKECTP